MSLSNASPIQANGANIAVLGETMGSRIIPQRYAFICDKCEKQEESSVQRRPSYWTELHWIKDALDYQGNAVADGSIKLLLCDKCSTIVMKALNAKDLV